MRISELSRHSGVAVPTIKFYLREGLIPKGEATGATQARYSEAHLHRLRLVRALVTVGGAPLSKVRTILAALDSADIDLHGLLGTTQYTLAPDPPPPEETGPETDSETARAQDRADALLDELGWQVLPRSPARRQLADTLAATARLGWPLSPESLRTYAEAAHLAAEDDVRAIDPAERRARTLERMVVTTILREQALMALHRLAQEDVSTRRFRAP